MSSKVVSTALVAVLLAFGPARAGDENRIGVVAKGQASAPADAVEVEFTVSVKAEESVEAEKKFRDKLQRVESAIREGEARPARKKAARGDDDEDEAPGDKKKPGAKAPKPAAAPKPARAPRPAEDEDEDAPPAKKARPKKADEETPTPEDKKPAAEPGEATKKETAPHGPGKDEKDGASIPIEVAEHGFTFGVKGNKADDSPMARIMARNVPGGGDKVEAPMHFSCKVVVTVRDVGTRERTPLARRLASIIDLAIEAGADGADGDAPVVRFVAKDPEALRKLAYADAMARARARAQQIASLAPASLEGVASVRESGLVTSPTRSDDPQATSEKMMAALYGLKSKEGGSPPASMELTCEVELQVEFQIAKPAPAR